MMNSHIHQRFIAVKGVAFSWALETTLDQKILQKTLILKEQILSKHKTWATLMEKKRNAKEKIAQQAKMFIVWRWKHVISAFLQSPGAK